ncbi:MAG: metallophosphoesterase family protein [Methanocellales archaeon]|nr:metallophosphoesterase family protein [Methanocellales archaeon]
MRLLAISDTHGNFSKVTPILKKAGDVDAILIVGDITNFGPEEKAKEIFDLLPKKTVLAVSGNCDPKGVLNVIETSGAVSLHNSSFKLGDVTFIGLGGSNPTPFNTPFEHSEEEIREMLRELFLRTPRTSRMVLLSHAPPRDTLDRTANGNVGSEAIREILGQVDLVVCGHIHEARGVKKVGNTTIVNPGKATNGYAAIITLNAEIKVDFIDVE